MSDFGILLGIIVGSVAFVWSMFKISDALYKEGPMPEKVKKELARIVERERELDKLMYDLAKPAWENSEFSGRLESLYHSSDFECPYCGEDLDADHDEGSYGYEEDTPHEQECEHCEKYFVYFTTPNYLYDSRKADCLNDNYHNYENTRTTPDYMARMRCKDCWEERSLTEEEWEDFMPGLVTPEERRDWWYADRQEKRQS